MTYQELINKLLEVAGKHKQVKSVGNGRQSEIDPADKKLYPTVWVVPISGRHTIKENQFTQRWDIGLLCGDLVHDNQLKEKNINLIHNKTYLILRDIIIKLHLEEDLKFEGDVTFEDFTDAFDGMTGWACRFTIRDSITPTACDLPFNP